jgi:hypothetical protein
MLIVQNFTADTEANKANKNKGVSKMHITKTAHKVAKRHKKDDFCQFYTQHYKN